MKKGFTLAEILITLGIIGIIAAITLPAIIGHYRKQTTITKLKKFYTEINQALLLSVVENGETNGWGYPGVFNREDTPNFYNRYFAKYLKSIKTEVYDYIPEEEYHENENVMSHLTNGEVAVYLSDGTPVFLTWAGETLHFIVVTWGYDKTENSSQCEFGQNCFMYAFSSRNNYKSIEPYGGVANKARCKTEGIYCAGLIQYDGWQIKSDYPHKL